MRILARTKHRPVTVCPGDVLKLEYRQHYPDGTTDVTTACEHIVTEAAVFDTGIVVAAEDAELEQLDCSEAIGGFFGKRR